MKLAIISDTHFGDPRGTLIIRDKSNNVLRPGPKYDAFRAAAGTKKEGTESVGVIAPKGDIYRLTRARMRGNVVKVIQRVLKAAGFDPGGIDGEFGPMTQAAVVAFQISRGLISDGEVGPRTASALGIEI